MFVLLFAIAGYAQPRAGDQKEPVFDVWEYEVHGNTVLEATTIERALYRFLGPGKSVRDVESARQALEQTYRKAGFATVQVVIPEQAVDGGVVELKVVPGRVGRVRVAGSRYYDQGRILARVPDLAAGVVPNFNAVQLQLNSVNRFPGRRVIPLLRAGDEPGTTEVELKVEEKRPYKGSLEINNRHSANTTSTRLNAAARYENLWQKQHSVGLQYQTAPEKPKEAQVWVLSYDAPSATSDDYYAFYAVRTKSDVATLGDISVLGNGKIYGLRWVAPLPGQERFTHTITAGADYKDFDEIVAVSGSSSIKTPIRYLPFTLSYEAYRRSTKGLWRFGTGFNFAIRGLVTKEAQFADKRFKARGNYFVWKWDVQRTHQLPKGFVAFAWLDGQAADQPLVSNEQYSAGGAQTVRGYLESEALGDEAVRGTFELRTPARVGRWPVEGSTLNGFVFLDAASLWLKDPLPGQTSRYRLSSTGLGLRFSAGRWKLSLDGGWPLKATINTKKGEPRLNFEVRFDF